MEKLHNGLHDVDNISEGGSMANDLNDAGELNNGRYNRSSFDGVRSSLNSGAIVHKEAHHNGQIFNAESGDYVSEHVTHLIFLALAHTYCIKYQNFFFWILPFLFIYCAFLHDSCYSYL